MKIRYIIDGWTYWDKTNGNSYYLTRVTHTNTGNSVIFDECPGNIRSVINKMEERRDRTGRYTYHACTHESEFGSLSYREYNIKRNGSYYAPVNQYHRTKRGKVTNITDKLIRKLAVKTSPQS